MCETTPTGVANDALGAVLKHEFYAFVIERLRRSKGWVEKEIVQREVMGMYVSVMAGTGPLFLSLGVREWEELQRRREDSWKLGERGEGEDWGKVVTLALEENTTGYNFFLNVEGRSWQGPDEKVVAWFERHWGFSIFGAVVGVVGLWEGAWLFGCKLIRGMGGVVRREMEVLECVLSGWEVPPL